MIVMLHDTVRGAADITALNGIAAEAIDRVSLHV